jgi:23S rRNA pseudouridine1911/1915/1917 synthase
MKISVPEDLDGERADRVVAVRAGLSRSASRDLIGAGRAMVDGRPIEPKTRLAAGSVIEVEIPAPPPPLRPEGVPFGVVYEDEHLAVVDKPPGIVVHPGAGHQGGTLAAGILERWPRVRGVGDDDRWGIVHRLDRDTSGLLVIALDRAALEGLSALLRRREIERAYLALVSGEPPARTGTIEAPIGRDPQRSSRFRIDPDGRHARTHYRLIRMWPAGPTSLLEVRLETGRTHQIRVHMASVGLPIYADGVYGRRVAGHRLWLHSVRLRFSHPITGEAIEAESAIPDDLQEVLDGLDAAGRDA